MTAVTCLASALSLLAASASGIDTRAPAGHERLIGEVRAVVMSAANKNTVVSLHHEGWLEARGQLLDVVAFPELYDVVGRTWTPDAVDASRFAIPRLTDRIDSSISSDNSFGVLGPGDLITSGRPREPRLRRASVSYWIYVGREVTAAVVSAERLD